MIPKEEIINLPKNKCGVYFLFDKNKNLMYIGESSNIYYRLLEHFDKPYFKYFRYSFGVYMGNYHFQKYERYLIYLNKPKYNYRIDQRAIKEELFNEKVKEDGLPTNNS